MIGEVEELVFRLCTALPLMRTTTRASNRDLHTAVKIARVEHSHEQNRVGRSVCNKIDLSAFCKRCCCGRQLRFVQTLDATALVLMFKLNADVILDGRNTFLESVSLNSNALGLVDPSVLPKILGHAV